MKPKVKSHFYKGENDNDHLTGCWPILRFFCNGQVKNPEWES